jgi:lipoyl(octanoyl) transferase
MAYVPALEIQRQTHEQVRQELTPPTLLLVEHDPVITVTRRPGVTEHLVSTPPTLAALGIEVQPTDRGGDVTYHGPGQLVAYPILRLNPLGLNVGRYMRLLEQVVIDTVAAFGVTGLREPGHTGVWVDSMFQVSSFKFQVEQVSTASTAAPAAKLCALGVRVSRGVTLHGLALNVSTNLDHFKTIVPCGLAGRDVTSLQQILGPAAPTLPQVKAALIASFQHHVDVLLRSDTRGGGHANPGLR